MYLVCYEKADGDDLMFEPIFREAPQQTPIVSPIFGRGICRDICDSSITQESSC